MTRLLVHVEGETEESFVNDLLAPYLYGCGFSKVGVRLIGNARQRTRRGGIRSWDVMQREIIRHLREDRESIASTMVDYYGLPSSGVSAWPGRKKAATLVFPQKAGTVENALAADIRRTMGQGFDSRRFIPYVMMHEFEALLFSDCPKFADSIDHSNIASSFQEIRDDFSSPEEIDDSPDTAPSKRIIKLVPVYQKRLHRTLAALEIGLRKMRDECPHFANWLRRLKKRDDEKERAQVF